MSQINSNLHLKMDISLSPILLEVIRLTLIGVLFFIINHFSTSYLKKKGENLATKEDIRAITEGIESVKASYNALLSVRKMRNETEFQTLKKISQEVYSLTGVLVKFHPSISALALVGQSKEVTQGHLQELHDQVVSFNNLVHAYQPFYSEKIFSELQDLSADARKWSNYIFRSLDEDNIFKSHGSEILPQDLPDLDEARNRVTALIKERVKEWEELD